MLRLLNLHDFISNTIYSSSSPQEEVELYKAKLQVLKWQTPLKEDTIKHIM